MTSPLSGVKLPPQLEPPECQFNAEPASEALGDQAKGGAAAGGANTHQPGAATASPPVATLTVLPTIRPGLPPNSIEDGSGDVNDVANQAFLQTEDGNERKRSRRRKGPRTSAAPVQFYAVRRGKTTNRCVYLVWDDCREQVESYPDAEYATFPTLDGAAAWILPPEEDPGPTKLPDEYLVEPGKDRPESMPRARYRHSRYGALSRDSLQKLCRARGIYVRVKPKTKKGRMIELLDADDEGKERKKKEMDHRRGGSEGGGGHVGREGGGQVSPKGRSPAIKSRYGGSRYGQFDRDELVTMCRARKLKMTAKKKGSLIDVLEADDAKKRRNEIADDGPNQLSVAVAREESHCGAETDGKVEAAAAQERNITPVRRIRPVRARYADSKYGSFDRDELLRLCRARKLKPAEKKKVYMIALLDADDAKRGEGSESADVLPAKNSAAEDEYSPPGESDKEVETDAEAEAEAGGEVEEASAQVGHSNEFEDPSVPKRYMYEAFDQDALLAICRMRSLKVTETNKDDIIKALKADDARAEGFNGREEVGPMPASVAADEISPGEEPGKEPQVYFRTLNATFTTKRPREVEYTTKKDGEMPSEADSPAPPPPFKELSNDCFQDFREAPPGCAWLLASQSAASGGAPQPGLPPTKRRKKLSWEARIAQCLIFLSEHGHLRIPSSHPELGTWVGKVRTQYGKLRSGVPTLLTEVQVRELEELGFQWRVDPEHRGEMQKRAGRALRSWEDRFEELRAFREAHGHTIVPRRVPGLGDWVHHQRGHLRKFYATGQTFHGMNAARATKLEEVGFILNVHEYKRNIKALSEETRA